VKTRRGVAIPTALFIVLLLFGLVTAIQLLTTENLRVTRYGHAKTRAAYKARSTADKVLFALRYEGPANANPVKNDFQKADGTSLPVADLLATLKTCGPDAPIKVKLDESGSEESFGRAYLRSTPDTDTPGLQLLMATGRDNEQSQQMVVAIEERPKLEGLLFARIGEGPDDQASTYYWYSEATNRWSKTRPVPHLYYQKTPSGGVELKSGEVASPTQSRKFARTAHFPTADDQGHLFLSLRRTGGKQIDTVMRFDVATDEWKPLHCVPRHCYKQDDAENASLITPAAPPRLKEMASNGSDVLYVRNPREDRPDTIFACNPQGPNPEANDWTTLPAVRKYVYDRLGRGTIRNGFVQNLTDLGADKAGNLYARWPREDIDTIYRYDRAAGAWGTLPLPPRRRWVVRRVDGRRQYVLENVTTASGAPLVAQNMRYLQVSRKTGKLYAIFNREGIDTLYEGTVTRNDAVPVTSPLAFDVAWKVLPPAPRQFYRQDGDTLNENDPLLVPAMRQSTLDGDGTLYFRWRRDAVDSIFGYDTENLRIVTLIDPLEPTVPEGMRLLAPPPNDYFQRHNIPASPDLKPRARDNTLNVLDLAGGGRAVSGQTEVVRGDFY